MARPSRRPGPDLQNVTTGAMVAIVGVFSSFPIVLQGLTAVGASPEQAGAGLAAAAISMAIAGIVLAWWRREPVSCAWSTPAVALLAVSQPLADGFAGAVAAFIVAGGLITLAGLWPALARLVTSVPTALAQAMLAGVLAGLCMAPFRGLAEAPEVALPILLSWFVVGRVKRILAVPAAVLAAFGVTLWAHDFSLPMTGGWMSHPVWVSPVFSLEAILSLGVPLFVVTMATQNIPAVAVLRSFGYTPPPGPLLAGVGGISLLTAPFGNPATCLAAITASMCANADSHPDPSRRYWSAVMAGVFYSLFGFFAVAVTAVAALAPPMTLQVLAGVALLPVFASSASGALQAEQSREGAAVTFLVTASGITLWGLGAAVWGLVLGGIVLAVRHRKS